MEPNKWLESMDTSNNKAILGIHVREGYALATDGFNFGAHKFDEWARFEHPIRFDRRADEWGIGALGKREPVAQATVNARRLRTLLNGFIGADEDADGDKYVFLTISNVPGSKFGVVEVGTDRGFGMVPMVKVPDPMKEWLPLPRAEANKNYEELLIKHNAAVKVLTDLRSALSHEAPARWMKLDEWRDAIDQVLGNVPKPPDEVSDAKADQAG